MIDWYFVDENALSDPTGLRLKYAGRRGMIPEERAIIDDSITQIECRRRYSRKFPGLFDLYPRFTFPSQLAAEQSSHLFVAHLHAYLASCILKALKSESSDRPIKLFDMTAGLGLDFISLARALTDEGRGAIAAEIDGHKADVLKENLKEVDLPFAKVLTGDSIDYLHTFKDDLIDIIFADPARRGNGNSRIYDPRDCQPDVVGQWDCLLDKAGYVMIKNSPMLDIEQALRLFPHTAMIAVVSVKGECKEVLIIAGKECIFRGTLCINLKDTEELSQYPLFAENRGDFADDIKSKYALWVPAEESSAQVAYAEMIQSGSYLYEPNASVMKARPWQTLLRLFPDLKKLSRDCHLFISDTLHRDFPGRILKVEREIDRRNRKELKGGKLNIISRAYPETPEQIARHLKIMAGGDDFLCGLSIAGRPILILASPIE